MMMMMIMLVIMRIAAGDNVSLISVLYVCGCVNITCYYLDS